MNRSVIALLLLAVLAGAGYGVLASVIHWSPALPRGIGPPLPDTVAQLPNLVLPHPATGSRINILIMGIDRRPGLVQGDRPIPTSTDSDPGETDTLAVLSIDPTAKTATVLSIPRDLWLEVPDGSGGWTTGRINTAYYVGAARHLSGGGPGAAMAAVSHNLGIPIDHYLLLDFSGFMDLIDAVGGIDLAVPNTITATVLPKANDGGYEYTFLAGSQHLNGELALAYARFRFDQQGDLGRVKRQQQVGLAVRQRLLSLGWLTQAPALFSKYHAAFDTDLPAYAVPGYALLANQVRSQAIQTRSLGEAGATTGATLLSGAEVLLPNPEVMAAIIGQSFDDPNIEATALAHLREDRAAGDADRVGLQRGTVLRPPSR